MFKSQNFCHIASNNRNNVKAGMFIYRTTDDLATVTANGYFNERIIDLNLHDIIVHEQIDNADPTKVKQNFLCVVQKTLTNVNTKIMDTDEVDGANTDLDNLSDTGKANISAEGTYDANASYDAGTVGAAIQSKADAATSANTDLSNLTSTGANIANWSSNVSNCITEIPQDIKLELNSGTLTLKAGSKCYLKTDTTTPSITIASDLTTTQTTDGTYFAIYDGSALTTVLTTTYDYDTLPSTYSLPLAILTVSSGAITSIDQTFNGFGFIGDTVYVLPGVVALIPDGRNADGTLKSRVAKTTSVRTQGGYTSKYTLGSNGVMYVANSTNYAESETQPSFNNGLWYQPSTNTMYGISSGVAHKETLAYVLDAKKSSGVVTNITPKLAFRAVDYSDTEYIAHQAMPSSRYTALSLGANGTTYTAPADGYYEVTLPAEADRFVTVVNQSNNLCSSCVGGATEASRVFISVSAKDNVKVYYAGTSTGSSFRFIYANGAK